MIALSVVSGELSVMSGELSSIDIDERLDVSEQMLPFSSSNE